MDFNRCSYCGTKFIGYHNSDLFCSKRCRTKYYSMLNRVPRCYNCSGYMCNHKKTYKGKTSPKDCMERIERRHK